MNGIHQGRLLISGCIGNIFDTVPSQNFGVDINGVPLPPFSAQLLSNVLNTTHHFQFSSLLFFLNTNANMQLDVLLVTVFAAMALAIPAMVPESSILEGPAIDARSPQKGEKCTPGKYRCSGTTIQVCNSAGNWTLSAQCSSRGCSVIGGTPHCL